MKAFNPDKELKKIQRGNRNKILYGIILILLIISIGSTYALYQVRYSKRIIYTKVAPFSSKDLILSVLIDGKDEGDVPPKGEGYYFDGIECDKDPDAVAGWDYTKWKLSSLSTTVPNKCSIKFTSHPTTVVAQIKYLNGLDNNLVIDDQTKDNNLRYIGKDPDNYVWFNCKNYDGLTNLNADDIEHDCEKWRIIGLMNHITKSDNNQDDLVKIIRAESAMDAGFDWAGGKNIWATSIIQATLNTDDTVAKYLNPNYNANGVKGITATTKEMIENVVWHVAGTGAFDNLNFTASEFYTAERGQTVPTGAPSIIWTGLIGLMYPSDYGYATGGLVGSETTSREGCLNQTLNNWGTDDYKTNCAENSWLLYSTDQNTITPITGNGTDYVISVASTGAIGPASTWIKPYANRPSLYLKANVKLTSGDGSNENPYIIIPQ